jgi:lambda family phage portal protein
LGWLDIFKRKSVPVQLPAPVPVRKRAYQAAAISRLTNDWILSATSADSEVRPAINVLRMRMRDLGRNNDYVRSYLSEIEKNIIGKGTRLQSNVRDASGKLDKNVNSQIETEWAIWGKKESCDVAGKLSFAQIERMLIRNIAESGEILIRKHYQRFGKSRIKLSLQVIESDHLDHDFNGKYGDNEVRMGVELNQYGRPVAYHLFKTHPGDNAPMMKLDRDRIRVDASEVLHLFIMERPNQSRGVPWLVSTVSTLRHLNGYIEAAVVKKRAQAGVMGFIETGDPEIEPPESEENGEYVEYFEAGTIKRLNPGEKVTVPNLGGGTESEFDPFVNLMLRKSAAGGGSSFESISKDFSKSNYSSSRLALLSERDLYEMIQSWFVESFNEWVFENWIEAGVLSGVFRFSDYSKNPDKYCSPKFMTRGWDWVDPSKDIEADKEALKAGLKTMSEILARKGKDFEETVMQISKEREFMKANGVETDIVMELSGASKNPQQKSNGGEPDET